MVYLFHWLFSYWWDIEDPLPVIVKPIEMCACRNPVPGPAVLTTM